MSDSLRGPGACRQPGAQPAARLVSRSRGRGSPKQLSGSNTTIAVPWGWRRATISRSTVRLTRYDGECPVAESDHHQSSCHVSGRLLAAADRPRISSARRETPDDSAAHHPAYRPGVCSRSIGELGRDDRTFLGVRQWEFASRRRDVITLVWKPCRPGLRERRRAACRLR